MMPDFRPLPEIDREIADLRIARADGTAPFGSARRLVELDEERAAVAAVACPRCGGSAVYSGPLATGYARASGSAGSDPRPASLPEMPGNGETLTRCAHISE